MGRILVIPNSDFSQNRILKVDIMKQVENGVDSRTPSSYASSTVLVSIVSDIKNNDQ